MFGRHCVRILFLNLDRCHSKHTESIRTQLLQGVFCLGAPFVVESLSDAIDNHRVANGKHALRFTLVMRRSSSACRTTTERRLRLKSNGISSTLSYPTMEGASCFKMASSRGLLMPASKWLFR